MKKILVSITLLSYLVVSSAAIVNFHYCMNRLASVQLFAGKTAVCNKCGIHIKKSQGCCRDEVKIVKLPGDQQKANVIYPIQAPIAMITVPSAYIVISSYNVSELCPQFNNSPPGLNSQDIYLQNCVFRI